jgi:hypothetical protein
MFLKSRWKRGPASGPAALVAVTRTDFSRYRDMPGATLAALRLRRAIPTTLGAIGVSLALQLPPRTTWSVSAWQTDEHLHQFLSSPAHLAIVTKYRARVTVRGERWTGEPFILSDALRAARELM